MNYYPRTMQGLIEQNLYRCGKIIVICGARGVGKTTLVNAILMARPQPALVLSCDEPEVRASLSDATAASLKGLIGRKNLVVIDEAQRVRDIGSALKVLAEALPEIQVIVTSSCALALPDVLVYQLFPLSIAELLAKETPVENEELLEIRLRFGQYPGVVNSEELQKTVSEIAATRLYQDVMEQYPVRNPDVLRRLLQALAVRVGSDVSYNELGDLAGIDKITTARYVDLLEKAFLVFHLPPLSRNLERELGRLRKIYFYDVGVRNALLDSFSPLSLRPDADALWENFVISERVKLNSNRGAPPKSYFWRTYTGGGIDYLEEKERGFFGFECRWGAGRWRQPPSFLAAYPGSELHLVNRANYLDFLK
jgi:predicted AAA+ superfamily ATPase